MARLVALKEHGYVRLQRVPVHPELELLSAEAFWEEGMSPPDFGLVSYRLMKRWNRHPVMTTLVSATPACASLFSGHCCRVSREVECRHDVHLSQVYLLYRLRHPSLLPFWVFEERLRNERGRSTEMLPDALIRSQSVVRALEFGGSYSKDKLQAFHDYCAAKRIGYEIW